MTTQPPAQELPELPKAETYLRSRYGAYRGHFAWRELEEAFNAGVASQAGRAEPIAWASADLEDIMSANLKAAHERANSFTPRDYPVALYATPPLEVRESAKCGYCGGSGSVNSWTTATSSDICFKCNGAGTATAKVE